MSPYFDGSVLGAADARERLAHTVVIPPDHAHSLCNSVQSNRDGRSHTAGAGKTAGAAPRRNRMGKLYAKA
jgi:hypothetical protein